MTLPAEASVIHDLPPAAYVDGSVTVHEIPSKPHAFQVDNFSLRELNGSVLASEANVGVLSTHASIESGKWRTGSGSNETIPEILEALEADGFLVDVIFACTEKIGLAGISKAIVVMNSGRPRVYMRPGHIATGLGLRTIQGKTHLDMTVASRENIIYEPWLNGRHQKSRIKVIK